jgi:hypothetical protein
VLPGCRASRLQKVDVLFGIRYRSIRIGPREADFQRGKQHAIDHQGLLILTPDPRMPQTFSGFEGLDFKVVIIHVGLPIVPESKETWTHENECELIHIQGRFFA